MTLPARTSPTPSNPSPASARPIAVPCGPRTPRFRVTCTRAFIVPSGCQLGLLRIGGGDRRLRQDAQAPGDLLIGLRDAAHVLAEAVLVHDLIGLGVPQAAGVRTDLVRQHDPHVVLGIVPSELRLEIDQLYAGAEEETAQIVVD